MGAVRKVVFSASVVRQFGRRPLGRRHSADRHDILQRDSIPTFNRRPFAVLRGASDEPAVNLSRDLIVRTNDEMPVGVVSKRYRLVQHSEVFDLAVEALKQAAVASAEVTCYLTLTRYGERMALRFQLPDRYELDLGDGNPMGLRLQCFNSVDGSMRFTAVLGWFRFVCSNGLIVGTATASLRGFLTDYWARQRAEAQRHADEARAKRGRMDEARAGCETEFGRVGLAPNGYGYMRLTPVEAKRRRDRQHPDVVREWLRTRFGSGERPSGRDERLSEECQWLLDEEESERVSKLESSR